MPPNLYHNNAAEKKLLVPSRTTSSPSFAVAIHTSQCIYDAASLDKPPTPCLSAEALLKCAFDYNVIPLAPLGTQCGWMVH